MVVLIHVHSLQCLAMGKDNSMVLILRLSLSNDDATARVPK